MNEFFARLKQRKLVQWALAYIAAAFALIQVIDVASDSYDWPHLVMHLVFGVLVLGFVVALVLAWYHGERGAQRVSGPELLLIALALAIGGGLLWHFGKTGSPAALATVATTAHAGASAIATGSSDGAQHNPGSIVPDAAAKAASSGLRGDVAAQPILAKSIAVLPFENLSTDKGNAYFADGIQDLILTKLADIGDLKVISRTSTESYGSHPGNLKSIGQQLGVATILEGSVQKVGNQVLINVQLVDANTDSHVWAQSYQRTLDNIFGVEGEVAQKVADALSAKLTAAETQAVAKVPTTNRQAYDDYLRGLHFDNEAGKGAMATYLPQAIKAYGKAVAEDPGFALAWAALSGARSDARYWGVDRSEANMRAANVAARRALALAPNLPDALLAMAGVQRFFYHDIAAARELSQRAVDLRPNDPVALVNLAISDAHSGDVAAAIKVLERTVVLDPTGAFPDFELGLDRTAASDYAGARRALSSALAINPQNLPAYLLLSRVDLLQYGDVKAAAEVLDNMAPGTPSNAALAAARIELLVYKRDFTAARALAEKYAVEFTAGPAAITVAMARANVEWLAGKKDAARAYYHTAVHQLGEPDANTGAFDHLELALAYARLGEGAAASKENDVAAGIDRRSHDMAGVETERRATLARTQLALGDSTSAIDLLGKMLARKAHGYLLSPALLRIDPTWDPIRHDPRFQALLKKYGSAAPAEALTTGDAVPASASSGANHG